MIRTAYVWAPCRCGPVVVSGPSKPSDRRNRGAKAMRAEKNDYTVTRRHRRSCSSRRRFRNAVTSNQSSGFRREGPAQTVPGACDQLWPCASTGWRRSPGCGGELNRPGPRRRGLGKTASNQTATDVIGEWWRAFSFMHMLLCTDQIHCMDQDIRRIVG